MLSIRGRLVLASVGPCANDTDGRNFSASLVDSQESFTVGVMIMKYKNHWYFGGCLPI